MKGGRKPRIEGRRSKIEDRKSKDNLGVVPGYSQSSIFDPRFSAPAIMLWAGVQLLAIALAASDFPIWAHHPIPQHALALDEMVAIQLLAVSVLCPILAADWGTIIINLLLSLAFSELAGMLAAAPQLTILNAWAIISLWKFGVCGWVRQLNQNRQFYVAILAILLSCGGAVVGYLRAENAAIAGDDGNFFYSPIGPVAEYLQHRASFGWIQTALPAILYLIWITFLTGRDIVRRPSTSFH